MCLKTWELFLDQQFDDVLINSCAHHVLKVVNWHEVLNDTTECPEGFFFSHNLQETSNDEVEALAVADMGVAISIGCTDTLNSVKDLLPKLLFKRIFSFLLIFIVLEKGLVRKCPWHVNVNLVTISCRILRVKVGNQGLIISVTLSK